MTTRAFAFANLIGGDNKISLESLWGEGRAFPNTNADLASSSAGETTI
jgi:hypothetical protein